MMKLQHYLLASLITIGVSASVSASDVLIENNALQLVSSQSSDSVQMTVTGPDGFQFSKSRSNGDNQISLSEMQSNSDGVYKYEFTEIETLGEREVNDEFNGRGQTIQKIVRSNKVSGHFTVKNGSLVNIQEEETSHNKTNSLTSKNNN